MRQVIIVGSGPAGYTAAIYAARANLAPLLIASSVEFGGELDEDHRGRELPRISRRHHGAGPHGRDAGAGRAFGTEIVYDDVVTLELEGHVKRGHARQRRRARGPHRHLRDRSAYRKLGLADETRLSRLRRLVVCHLRRRFFRQKKVAVVGGGDSALEEATFLTRFADKVYLVHRTRQLRASGRDAGSAPSPTPRSSSSGTRRSPTSTATRRSRESACVDTGDGDRDDPRRHRAVRRRSAPTRARTSSTASSTSPRRARSPSTAASSRTKLPGVFAAGDVVDPTYKQADHRRRLRNRRGARRRALPRRSSGRSCSPTAEAVASAVPTPVRPFRPLSTKEGNP